MNQNLYDTNLNFLLTNRRISALNEDTIANFRQPEEAWVTSLTHIREVGYENQGIQYHSKRDPQREAQRQIEHAIEGKKTHLVCLGAGLGFPLTEALKNPRIESILILETQPEILYYCLSLCEIYNTEKDVYFYFCPSPEVDSLENILPFFQNKNLDKIAVYNHRPSFQIPESKFFALEKQLKSIMYKRAINQATIIKFQGLWNKNIALNIKELIKGNTLNNLISDLKGKIENIVICGAGPSLAESYEDLKQFREKYFLISVDTAFIPLVKNNIKPDIVISADPQWLNHFFAMSPLASQSVWLMDPVVCYQSSHYLSRIHTPIYWWDNPFHLDHIIRNFQSRGEIAHGGSVSTNSFDLALKLNPVSITLIGQDLSFSHKTAHVKGAVLESMVFFKNNRFQGFEMHNLRQMKSLPPRRVSNCIDKKDVLYTNDKMQVFIDWFENQIIIHKSTSKIKFFNATRRGVFLRGFIHSPLSEILSDSVARVDSMSQLKEFASNDSNESAINRFAQLQQGCSALEVLYKKNLLLSKKTWSASSENLRDIYSELTKNDERIKKYSEVNQILSINAQSSILKITELGDETSDSAFMLYKSMYLSARKLRYFFNKIIRPS